jgi:hypothetical protein
MQLTQSTPLEQSIVGLHTDNPETKERFYGSIVSILQNEAMPYFTKADKIANAFMNIDSKIQYIKEQTKLLQQVKKQLELSRTNAKEQVAKALTSFDVSKLEGVTISSITVNPASEIHKTFVEALDKDALIRAGFFTVVVDMDAVEEALYSADQRHEVETYVNTRIEVTQKPASIRINKRKVVKSDSTNIEAA